MEYQYGIMQRNVPGLHRGPMTKEAAEEWVQSWIDDCTPEQGEAVRNLFYVVKRPVGQWEALGE